MLTKLPAAAAPLLRGPFDGVQQIPVDCQRRLYDERDRRR
jgi:hypothetical protein